MDLSDRNAAGPRRLVRPERHHGIRFQYLQHRPNLDTSWHATATYPFPQNTWHYVTAVGGNGQLSLYFDGALAKTTAISADNFGESEYNFNIGGGGIFSDTGNFFTGQIDEVAVWFRALSTNEITSLLASNSEQVSFTSYINTDVSSRMYRSNATAYVRIPFNLVDANAFDSLQLLMRYDDGFVGVSQRPFDRQHQRSRDARVEFRRHTTASRQQAVQWSTFDVSGARQWLQPGNNVLAIQALNIAPSNTDFLMQAQLVGQGVSPATAGWRFFSGPTPGGPNGTSTNDFGPVMSGAAHSPKIPNAGTRSPSPRRSRSV